MAKTIKQKKTVKIKYLDKVDPNLKGFGHDPYFLKKAEEAKAFLRRVGVPEGKAPLEEL